MPVLEKYFKRKHIEPNNILYIYRNSGKTVICSESGEIASSSVHMQDLLEFLPEGEFISISRSAIVRRDKILNLDYSRHSRESV